MIQFLRNSFYCFAILAVTFAASLDLRAEDAEHVVDVRHGNFEPTSLTIQAGDTIQFNNKEAMPGGGHIIMLEGTDVESAELAKDETWAHTFSDAGTYRLIVKGHEGGDGLTVDVTAN